MRAIIIQDADAKALLAKLELQMFHQKQRYPSAAKGTITDVHRWFHYVVMEWLQEQGATVT